MTTAPLQQMRSWKRRSRWTVPCCIGAAFVALVGLLLLGLWNLGDDLFFAILACLACWLLVFVFQYILCLDRYPVLGLWAALLFACSGVGLQLTLLTISPGASVFDPGLALLVLASWFGSYCIALPLALADRARTARRSARWAVAIALCSLPVSAALGGLISWAMGFHFK